MLLNLTNLSNLALSLSLSLAESLLVQFVFRFSYCYLERCWDSHKSGTGIEGDVELMEVAMNALRLFIDNGPVFIIY